MSAFCMNESPAVQSQIFFVERAQISVSRKSENFFACRVNATGNVDEAGGRFQLAVNPVHGHDGFAFIIGECSAGIDAMLPQLKIFFARCNEV